MKKSIQRHVARILCALSVALVLNYFFSHTQQGWLPLTTVIVMLTSTGNAFYQGLLRFFLIIIVFSVGSLFFSEAHLIFPRMCDIVLGALIGISCNMIILPDQIDMECRNAFVPILQSYARYFSAIVVLLLEHTALDVEREKIEVEKNLQTLPTWIYEPGFDVTLQKGYRYFFMKTGQAGELLFAMHHLARYDFSPELLNNIRAPLLQCVARFGQFISSLVAVLELQKLKEGISDFGAELAVIEEKFKAAAPPMLDMADVEKEYLYLAGFIYDLQDLRNVLLRMAEALR